MNIFKLKKSNHIAPEGQLFYIKFVQLFRTNWNNSLGLFSFCKDCLDHLEVIVASDKYKNRERPSNHQENFEWLAEEVCIKCCERMTR